MNRDERTLQPGQWEGLRLRFCQSKIRQNRVKIMIHIWRHISGNTGSGRDTGLMRRLLMLMLMLRKRVECGKVHIPVFMTLGFKYSEGLFQFERLKIGLSTHTQVHASKHPTRYLVQLVAQRGHSAAFLCITVGDRYIRHNVGQGPQNFGYKHNYTRRRNSVSVFAAPCTKEGEEMQQRGHQRVNASQSMGEGGVAGLFARRTGDYTHQGSAQRRTDPLGSGHRCKPAVESLEEGPVQRAHFQPGQLTVHCAEVLRGQPLAQGVSQGSTVHQTLGDGAVSHRGSEQAPVSSKSIRVRERRRRSMCPQQRNH